jgi:outer membrane protein OmpA-like peptidoglycan-associated protein
MDYFFTFLSENLYGFRRKLIFMRETFEFLIYFQRITCMLFSILKLRISTDESVMMKFVPLSVLTAAIALMTSLPASAQMNVTKPVFDRHGDLVLDRFEKCVRTRWEDQQDMCGTDAEATLKMDREFLTVYFAFDNASLTPAAQAKLDQVVDMLKSSETVESVNVVGYADPIGTSDYNQSLSQRRAKAVEEYLASRGYLDVSKVDVRALGEAAPLSQCEELPRQEKIACLWRDRRVEIELNLGY